ncbi:MAG: GOLPH3/VPS74 family protein [Pseudonocardiaceae bacterium]
MTVTTMEHTLAEDLLLLALNDAGATTSRTKTEVGLAGALLVDLGRGDALHQQNGRLFAMQGAAPSHPALARTHALIATSGRQQGAKSWVRRLRWELKPITATVAGPLVERGVLASQRSTVLGLIHTTLYPQADPGPRDALRRGLREVLRGERDAAEREALLLGLLVPLGFVGKLVDRADRRAATRRAKAVADGGLAGTAVADTIRDLQAAVVAAVSASAAGASGGDGGGGGG